MKFNLTIEQYLIVIRNELAKQLSDRCGVRIDDNSFSIAISWDNWKFKTVELKTLYDNGYPIEDCVNLIVVQAQDEFAKLLVRNI